MRDTNWTRKHMKGIRNKHEHCTTGYEFETRTQSGIRIQSEPSILRVNWTRGRTYICQFIMKTRMDDWIGNENEHSRIQHDLTYCIFSFFLVLLQPISFYLWYSSNVLSNRPWWSLTVEVKRRHSANGPLMIFMMMMMITKKMIIIITFIYSIKYISKVKNAINNQIKIRHVRMQTNENKKTVRNFALSSQ